MTILIMVGAPTCLARKRYEKGWQGVFKEMKQPYIRGWRQLTAVYVAFWALFTGNWWSFRRELHIVTGFARYYKITFAPSFWVDRDC